MNFLRLFGHKRHIVDDEGTCACLLDKGYGLWVNNFLLSVRLMSCGKT